MHCSLVHSFIFDVNDIWWEDKLTVQDAEAIKSAGYPHLPTLDPTIQAMFSDIKSAVSTSNATTDDDIIDAVWQAVTSLGFFNPRTHPQHEWLQRTILDFLAMYRNHTLEDLVTNGSEQDLINRCWTNIDKCFEDIAVAGR